MLPRFHTRMQASLMCRWDRLELVTKFGVPILMKQLSNLTALVMLQAHRVFLACRSLIFRKLLLCDLVLQYRLHSLLFIRMVFLEGSRVRFMHGTLVGL